MASRISSFDHQSETCDGVSQPAAAINARQDNEEWEGRRQSNEADEIVASSGEGDTRSSGKPGSVATEPNGKDGANEQKLARRKRRCPVVKIEEYLYNNGEDEGESKVDGRSDKRRARRVSLLGKSISITNQVVDHVHSLTLTSHFVNSLTCERELGIFQSCGDIGLALQLCGLDTSLFSPSLAQSAEQE